MTLPVASRAVTVASNGTPAMEPAGTLMEKWSSTRVTVMVSVSESLGAPPGPELPRSFVTTVSIAVPAKAGGGVKMRPVAAARVVLTAASGANSVTRPDPFPVTLAAVTAPVTDVFTVSFPVVTFRTTDTGFAPASTSAMLIPERDSGVSAGVELVGGSVLTGASLRALTAIDAVSVSVSGPPVPLWPRSSVVMVSVTGPLAFSAGVNRSPLVLASVALMADRLAVTTSVPVPLLVTCPAATPPPTVVLSKSVPEVTASVTFTLPPPASGSATDRPLRVKAISSAVANVAGSVFTGGWFGVTLGWIVVGSLAMSLAVFSSPPPDTAAVLTTLAGASKSTSAISDRAG